MTRVEMSQVKSRLGDFGIIRIGGAVIVTPCDTRMKIIASLARKEMTAEELSKATGVGYSTIMDHMELLERLGVVVPLLKRSPKKRRMYFRLNEEPLDVLEDLPCRSLGV
jgi:DNA-binding transcriptional ArsR family regulator